MCFANFRNRLCSKYRVPSTEKCISKYCGPVDPTSKFMFITVIYRDTGE